MIIKSESNNDKNISNGFGSFIYNGKAGPVIPRSNGQLKCIKAIDSNDLIFITVQQAQGKRFYLLFTQCHFLKSKNLKKLFYAVLQLKPVKIWVFTWRFKREN